jgi:hypothetical protein
LYDRLRTDIAVFREILLAARNLHESMWLAAAVSFPSLCRSPDAQQALTNAAAIASQFGFPVVSQWIQCEVLAKPVGFRPPAHKKRDDEHDDTDYNELTVTAS